MHPARAPRSLRLLLGLALAGGSLAACGNDDDDPAVDDTEATDPDDGDEGAAPGDGETIEVDMFDYGYDGLPEAVSVGTTLTVTNSSDAEVHEIVAIRIRDDEDRPMSELVALPEEEQDGLAAGPPAMVLVAAPGGPQIDAVGDGSLNEEGRYLVACFIPTGADPDEFMAAAAESEGPPDVAGGPPHIAQGMWAELNVE